MYTNSWEIIRDDSKRTFEICGQSENNNHFANTTHGMQKAGMAVSAVILPVSNKSSSRESIKISGYTREDGLYERLLKESRKISMGDAEDW
jgi:hypothetical protein